MADSDSPVPVDKTDVNAPGVRGSTALVDAAARGNVNSLQILLQSKSIDVNQPSKYGYTPLHCAVAENREDVVAMLLARDDLEVDKINEDGLTALGSACGRGKSVAIIKALIKNGARHNGNKQSGTSYASPQFRILWQACDGGHVEVVRTLLYCGFPTESADLRDDIDRGEAPHWGKNPLHRAAELGHAEIVQLLSVFGGRLSHQSQGEEYYEEPPEDDDNKGGWWDYHDSMIGNGHFDEGDAQALASHAGHSTLAEWIGANTSENDYRNPFKALQVAAGSRLHRDAAMALRLGVIDPEVRSEGFMRYSTRKRGWPSASLKEMLSDFERTLLAATTVGDWTDAPDVCPITVKLVENAYRGWRPASHWLYHRRFRVRMHLVLLVSERLRQVAAAPTSSAVADFLKREEKKEKGGAERGETKRIAKEKNKALLKELGARRGAKEGEHSAAESNSSSSSLRGSSSDDDQEDSEDGECHVDKILTDSAAGLPLLPPEMWLHILSFCCRSFWEQGNIYSLVEYIQPYTPTINNEIAMVSVTDRAIKDVVVNPSSATPAADQQQEDTQDPLEDVDMSKWKVAKLKAELKERGLAVGGKKTELVQRLTEAVAPGFKAGGGKSAPHGDEGEQDNEIQVQKILLEFHVKQANEAAAFDDESDGSESDGDGGDSDEEGDGGAAAEDGDDAGAAEGGIRSEYEMEGDDSDEETQDPLEDVDVSKWKVAELKAELKERGLAVGGKKTELVQRLTEDVASGSKAEDGDGDDDEDSEDGGDTVCIVMSIGGEGDMRAFRSADAMAAAEGVACDDDEACEMGYCEHCGWSEFGAQEVPKGREHVWVVSDWCSGCCIQIIRICATESAANDTSKACEEDGGWGGIEVQGEHTISKLTIE